MVRILPMPRKFFYQKMIKYERMVKDLIGSTDLVEKGSDLKAAQIVYVYSFDILSFFVFSLMKLVIMPPTDTRWTHLDTYGTH
uniref:Uncharacterized protein n=1 Tax=Gossypium raimondii TaxID=29730 RepID=A0A0D2SB52_GOSRA|nr:hypothetical protein B456_007G229600 [Gossypium raimondii]